MGEALRLEALGIGALEGVDLTLAPGEVLCLSGASGSGKSRLLRAIADLEPHEGEAWLGDTARSSLPAHRWRARVMLVPAESHWWAERVEEHLAVAPSEADLAALGFADEVLGWEVARLSSGEKQRLALLRAVAVLDERPDEAAALLLDEPTANLDEAMTQAVEAWLCERLGERGWPTLWVAHDPGQIARVAKRHWHIEGHRLVERETRPWQ
ncbi:ATP-binding cassette domain-containing protein [Halomonas pacifica]|uniref:ABC transporter ATP-binding protein n=1 Tax=Bisbaumannia pacifica TaxID=77098 RepID=UPI00235841F0|nr:ATP-binding cassette domain-containing protein [Halomonas pacifica]MDC8804143.1 ATP-binding cassette domain-containing protein [Halomonas pacifica]